jgi:hypothetical protein
MNASVIHGTEPGPLETCEPRSNVEPSSSRAAAIVATIYLAIIACTPLILRYSPLPDAHAVVAVAERIDHPRCAVPSESAFPCTHLFPRAQPDGRSKADL